MRRAFRPGSTAWFWCFCGIVSVTLGVSGVAWGQQQVTKSGAEAPKVANINAEYRVRTLRVDPFELSGNDVEDTVWTEQRLRLDTQLRYKPVTFTIQADVLDGVLFGDNGTFGSNPSPISGVTLASRQPNLTTFNVGLPAGRDPLNPDSYVPVLRAAEPVIINHAYADVSLPFGLLRVGRQPLNYGAGVATHDGSRINHWGVSVFNDSVDRALFATKLDQAYYVATRDGHVADTSMDQGLFVGFFYDWYHQGQVQFQNDNLRQIGFPLQLKIREASWFGMDWRNIEASAVLVNIQNERFSTNVFSVPFGFKGTVNSLSWYFQGLFVDGASREISEGFAALGNGDPQRQEIKSKAFYGRLEYQLGPVQLMLEGGFAEGDDDPRPSTPITSATFARDLNMGLLLFEHLIAFESARSVAVGIENLSSLDSASFPITEASTEGRFNNAIAIFPQLKLDFLPRQSTHKLHFRFGTLFAWPEADGGVVDPILTALNEDGERIDDDAVNWHGGSPGNYYGTEFDFQLQWSIHDRFFWTVESAVLVPGSSLQDANGDAVNAFFFENRFTYVY